MKPRFRHLVAAVLVIAAHSSACGNDNDGAGTAADRLGIGAECTSDVDCLQSERDGFVQHCLSAFKGGYCGLKDCSANTDCPRGSACVAHSGTNYCFRQCDQKLECNRNRTLANEANCSSSIDFVEAGTPGKACVPPSG